MSFQFVSAKRGPGYWKFNTQLLHDKDYLDKINNLLDIELAQEYKNNKIKWENIKLSIRGTTLQYAARKAKSKRNIISALEHKIKFLEDTLVNQTGFPLEGTNDRILQIKREIKTLVAERTKGAVLRSRTNWQLLGNKPTKYFLNLEKYNKTKKTLHRLKIRDGIVTDPNTILNELSNYYAKLYKSSCSVDESFLEDIKFPRITDEAKKKADSLLTQTEIGLAIKAMANNKCPGTDGLPIDFYKVFYGKLKPFLHALFLEIASDGIFHLTARRGILSLLEKVGKDILDLNCWQPLSLLNVDNKIYSKILATRLQVSFPEIIHSTQRGFVKNCYLAENLIVINELIHQYQLKELPGVIISFDFRKAFDALEWKSMFIALEKFGFGQNYINMVKVLFNQPTSCVINNGYWSKWFEISRSCRQGCCLSPSIFTLTVEILSLAIRQNPQIKGLYLGDTEIKIRQYADDLWSALDPTSENINNMLSTLDHFAQFSGLVINLEKSAVIRIGSLRNSNAIYYTQRKLFWSDGPVKILGIYVSTNWVEAYSSNFLNLLDTIRQICDTWSNRTLDLFGKVTVINTLIVPLFIHKFMALPSPPESFFKMYKSIILKFLWDNKPHRISYNKLVLGYDQLGIKLTDLSAKNTALKAAWIKRWVVSRTIESSWLYSSLPVTDIRIWNCNLSNSDLCKIIPVNTLSTMLSIWEAWCKCNYDPVPVAVEKILNMPLWGNSEIRRENKPILQRKLTSTNVNRIIDIIDVQNGQSLTYVRLVHRHGHVFDELYYLGLLAAIPNRWKIELHNNLLPSILDDMPEWYHNPSKYNSKSLYWQHIHNNFPSGQTTRLLWEKDLEIQIEEETWREVFPAFLKNVVPTKLRSLQYKILTRTVVTNKIRNKWDPNVQNKCGFCRIDVETMTHLFFECPIIYKLWKCLEKWIKRYLGVTLTPTLEIVILNNYRGSQKKLINMFIMIMKQYVYSTKCLGEYPLFIQYTEKIVDWYNMERLSAFQTGHIKAFQVKWKKYAAIM